MNNCWVGEKRWKTTNQQCVSYDDATYVLSCKCVYEKYYYKQRQMNWNHTCAVSKYVTYLCVCIKRKPNRNRTRKKVEVIPQMKKKKWKKEVHKIAVAPWNEYHSYHVFFFVFTMQLLNTTLLVKYSHNTYTYRYTSEPIKKKRRKNSFIRFDQNKRSGWTFSWRWYIPFIITNRIEFFFISPFNIYLLMNYRLQLINPIPNRYFTPIFS